MWVKRWRQWLTAAVLAAIVGALVVRSDELEAAVGEIGRLDPSWALVLFGLVAVGIVIDGVYTSSVTPQLSIARAAMLQQSVTAANNSVIGSGPVSTGMRIAMMRSWNIGDTSIGVSIVALNVIAAYRLWLIAGATAIAGVSGADGGVLDTRVYWLVMGVAAVVLSCSTVLWWVLLWHPVAATRLAMLAQRCWQWLRRRIRRLPAVDLVSLTERSRSEARDILQLHRWRIVAATVADQAVTVVKPLAVVRAFGIDAGTISTAQVLIAYGLIRLVVALTPIPGGIGITEFGLAALLTRFGGPETTVLAAVLTYRTLTFVLPIITGGVCFTTWRWQRRAHEPCRPSVPTICADQSPTSIAVTRTAATLDLSSSTSSAARWRWSSSSLRWFRWRMR